jgi:hypothetical protein
VPERQVNGVERENGFEALDEYTEWTVVWKDDGAATMDSSNPMR